MKSSDGDKGGLVDLAIILKIIVNISDHNYPPDMSCSTSRRRSPSPWNLLVRFFHLILKF